MQAGTGERERETGRQAVRGVWSHAGKKGRPAGRGREADRRPQEKRCRQEWTQGSIDRITSGL